MRLFEMICDEIYAGLIHIHQFSSLVGQVKDVVMREIVKKKKKREKDCYMQTKFWYAL